MLAGLVAAPSDYSPYVNMELARERQRHVLDRMAESGYITREQADEARTTRRWNSRASGQRGCKVFAIPGSPRTSIAQLEHEFGKQATYEGGLQVYTTLDPQHGEARARSGRLGRQATANSKGSARTKAALVAIRPSTGEIVAMIGGTHFSLAQSVQPRLASAPPAGFVIQSVRVHRGDRQRHARRRRSSTIRR